ncbi:ComF family protein [Streptomyces sp. NPDC058424]|uniref:ComF family protein n=1 Tax=Streptomyces sp. NPDC058424 TaxID=3346491 RepID=UPI00364F99BF
MADQSGLTSRQRLENLAGALEVTAGGARLLLSEPVVLIDDVMTTGASLAEAARAVTTAVYTARGREGMRKRKSGSRQKERKEGNSMYGAPEMAGVYGAGGVVCAAVVAASPDSFGIDRN